MLFVSSQHNGANLTCYKVSEEERVLYSYPNLVPHHISGMVVAPNGHDLMIADVQIIAVDLRGNQRINAWKPSGKPALIRDLAISPDGKLLVSVAQDRFIRVWDVNQWEELISASAPVPTHHDVILCAKFSPDGLHLLTGSGDYNAYLWSVEN